MLETSYPTIEAFLDDPLREWPAAIEVRSVQGTYTHWTCPSNHLHVRRRDAVKCLDGDESAKRLDAFGAAS